MKSIIERCRLLESSLPVAPYRTNLTALHDEMLAEIEAKDALLRQALYLIEAWERGAHNKDYERDIYETSTAIKERLGESTK